MLISQVCKQADFETDWFKRACEKLKEPFKYHRKLWEYCYIYEALLQNGVLKPTSKGLGFGVGKEPLAAAFASHGCEVTATDLHTERAFQMGWVSTNQHSKNLLDLNERGICDPHHFQQLVSFEFLDMNHIPEKFTNAYDFTWSSCAFEHCGNIELGRSFIINQMLCLKPGGVAVHTTEFNLTSNEETIDHGTLVLFRKQDIEWMVEALRSVGYSIEIDYTLGTAPIETYVDLPPYQSEYHLRLQLLQFTSTSIGLIIKKTSN
ncbi:MAG TPA: SAM-dependent methyltransferase [Paenibacillaceae bacterium]|nr:SAM-dependent methyltransferase [Paenibacillaceae bacterium]